MKRNKKGFTIVELVIVIGVIGILSAILIPTFVTLTSRAQEAARKEECANAYSGYLANLEEAKPLAQDKVVIEYKNAEAGHLIAFGANGWAEDSTANKTGDVLYFVDVNNSGDVYEPGVDIGVFAKATA